MKKTSTAFLAAAAIVLMTTPDLARAGQAALNVPAEMPDYRPALPAGTNPAIAAREPDAPVTGLIEAITLAYGSNPDLLAQRDTLNSTDSLYPGARAAYGPKLDARASQIFTRSRSEYVPGVFTPSQGWANTASLILSQPVFSFGRRYTAEVYSLTQVKFSREQLRLQESQVMLGVVSAYMSVIRDRQIVDISEQNLRLLEQQYRDNGERFKVRDVTATDVQQVLTRLEIGRAQLLGAQGQLQASTSQFLRIVGGLPGQLAAPAPLDLGVTTLDEAYAQAELHSPLIQAARAREKLSRVAIAAAKAETMPDVSLQGSASYGTITPYTNDYRQTQLIGAAVVNVPLIDSGVRRARIEQATQANQADWRLVDSALRETRQAIASAWDSYLSAQTSLSHYSQAVEAAQKAYEGATIQAKAGAVTTLDVLDLARDLLNVRTNYVGAQAGEQIARANLRAAMGSLEAPMLAAGITRYDPTTHFERQRHRGDLPIITPLLSKLDSIGVHDLRSDRPVRDPAGQLRSNSMVSADSAETPAQ